MTLRVYCRMTLDPQQGEPQQIETHISKLGIREKGSFANVLSPYQNKFNPGSTHMVCYPEK